jgi:hypothetical protein
LGPDEKEGDPDLKWDPEKVSLAKKTNVLLDFRQKNLIFKKMVSFLKIRLDFGATTLIRMTF